MRGVSLAVEIGVIEVDTGVRIARLRSWMSPAQAHSAPDSAAVEKNVAARACGYVDKCCALPHIPTGSTTRGEMKIKDPVPRP